MPDIFDLLRSWWKQIFMVVFLSLLAVGIITFFKPRQYLSVCTAVPASSFATDKAKVFNDNIQQLYSALGNPDDLDRVLGTAQLDTVYLAVASDFNLFDHYKLNDKSEEARMKSANMLRGNTKVMKSEYGELKIKVWDTDKELAPQLANAIMNELQAIHQHLQAAGNESILNVLKLKKAALDTLALKTSDIDKIKRMSEQSIQYEKLIDEYQLIVDSKPLALIVVEKAKPANHPDRPKRLQIMIATAVLSFLFAFLASLILERRKNTIS